MRTLKTHVTPALTRELIADSRVITPHRSAANELQAPFISLRKLAGDRLKNKELMGAPAIVARQILTDSIARVAPDFEPTQLASRIGEILRTVLRTGLEPELLIENGSPRVRQLGIITLAYVDALRREKYIDREELLWQASQIEGDKQRLAVWGHFRARKEEIVFINSIAAEGSIYFLPVDDHPIFGVNRTWAEWLKGRGWELDPELQSDSGGLTGRSLAAAYIGMGEAPPEVFASAYSNIESEVRGTLAEIKRLTAAGADPYSFALVCRDQHTYGPVLKTIGGEYGLPLRIRYDVNLAETIFGSFVRLLLEAVESDFAFDDTSRLLMHPYGPGLSDGKWAEARARHTSGKSDWSRLLNAGFNFEWEESRPLAEWANSLDTVFKTFDIRRKTAERAREITALAQFTESLRVTIKRESPRPAAFEHFAALVREILSNECVPFDTSNVGIPLFEPNTILGASFEHLFVLGLAEGVFPAPATDNPVIDFYERKKLIKYGIEFEEADEVARWEELSFFFTLQSARSSVHLSFPKTIENSETLKSSFFDKLKIDPVEIPDTISSVSSTGEFQKVVLRHHGLAEGNPVVAESRRNFAVELSREMNAAYCQHDGLTGIAIDPASRRWSVSQLTTLGQCSFRWFSQKVLRLDPAEEFETGLDPAVRGTFYHKVLEIAVGKAMHEDDIRTATLQFLEESFAEAEAADTSGLTAINNWDLRRDEHLRALRKAIAADQFIAPGARVLGLEQEFDVEWNGFRMKGSIDRVDDTPEGLAAIDYKTSSVAPKGAQNDLGKLAIDLQLPIYSQIALRHLYPEGRLGTSSYYSLTKGKTLKKVENEYPPELDTFLARIKKTLESGRFPVEPDIDMEACKYCEYTIVCRRGPRLSRKKSGE